MDVSIGTRRGDNQLSISRNQWGILKRSYINSFYKKKFLTHKKGHPDISVILNAGPERGMFDTLLPFSILQKVDLCATA